MNATKTCKPKPALKNLTDWFSRVYVINCQHRPDRKAAVIKHLKATKMVDIKKVTIYPAIIGDYTGHPAGWSAGRGAWGCLQSHRRIMEDVMHARDERGDMVADSTLILEDDVFFLDGALANLNAFMENVPSDWGQLYLGGQHRRPAKPTAFENVFLAGSVNRTHAYAVSRQHIQKVYQHISYLQDYHSSKHIDHQLELAHQRGDWPVYCPARWICGQRAGTSNISGKDNPDMTWQ